MQALRQASREAMQWWKGISAHRWAGRKKGPGMGAGREDEVYEQAGKAILGVHSRHHRLVGHSIGRQRMAREARRRRGQSR